MKPGVLALSGTSAITGRGDVSRADPAVRPDVLPRLWGKLGDNGQVLLGDDAWDWLIQPPDGWQVSGGPAWWTARTAESRLRIGKVSEINPDNDPLLGDDLMTTVIRHQRFANSTGVPFFGDGGTTCGLLMDATISVLGRYPLRTWDNPEAPRVPEPYWCGPWEVPRGEYHATLTLDKNAQFLCAANAAFLPLDAPEHTGAIPWDPHRAGLWKIVVPKNPYEGLLPHPCGHMASPGGHRWVAGPTVELLAMLDLEITILDSWTCCRDRSRRLLRTWYETLRDARAEARKGIDDDSLAIQQAVKDVYSRGISHLDKSPARRWYRPDWKAILNARSRVGVWRAMWQAGTVDMMWPLCTSTDSVSYDTAEPPPSYKIGSGMGEWKVVS